MQGAERRQPARAALTAPSPVPYKIQPALKRLSAAFYCTASGREPVREWLRTSLGREDRIRVGTDIRKVEFGWPLGLPTCRPLGLGLWETRTDLVDGIARVIFCIGDGRMVLLHGFVKKSRKTPKADLALARRRMKELDR